MTKIHAMKSEIKMLEIALDQEKVEGASLLAMANTEHLGTNLGRVATNISRITGQLTMAKRVLLMLEAK